MPKLMVLLGLLAWAAMPSGALAAQSSALDLYVAGKYEEAMAAGAAQNDGGGYVVAARAALADAMMHATPCLDCFKRVETYARRAIAEDARQPDAHVYVAVALGYESRIIGILQARSNGNAETAKKELDAALAIDPNDAWALAALGGWNIEIVRHAGAMLGRMLYGASVAQGQVEFAKAFAVPPDRLVLHFQYALSLSGYDPDRYRTEIGHELAVAAKAIPATAYEKFTRARAIELAAALQSGDHGKFDALVARDQAYPQNQ
jgi:hypothetical protein